MLEINIFKEHYFRNRLIWVRGPIGAGKVRTVYRLLSECGVEAREVLELTASQFVEMYEKPSLKPYLFARSVLLVKIPQVVSSGTSSKAKKASRRDPPSMEKISTILTRIQRERFRLGIRLVLVSSEEIAPFELHHPFVLQIPGLNPQNLNERLQSLLGQASQVVGKNANGFSDCAANFFLKVDLEPEDEEDLLELLILGVARSEGGVVRLTDLFHPDILKVLESEGV